MLRLLYINFLQAIRHMKHHGRSLILSVTGLACGLVCFCLSASDLWFQTHYDSFRPDYEELYQVQRFSTQNKRMTDNNAMPPSWLADLRQQLPPGVLAGAISYDSPYLTLSGNRTEGTEVRKSCILADSLMAKVLNIRTLQGHIETLFKKPGQIVLTDSLAMQLFGTPYAVGRSVHVSSFYYGDGKNDSMQVAAVVKYETHTAIPFWCMLPYMPGQNITDQCHIFIRTAEPDYIKQQMALCDSMYNYKSEWEDMRTTLQPLRMMPLLKRNSNLWEAAFYPLSFLLLSMILLIGAAFNYISLSTTMWLSQKREYRLRLCLGGGFRSSIHRWLVESILGILLAWLTGAFILDWAYRIYNPLVGKTEVYLWYTCCGPGLLFLILFFSLWPLSRIRKLYSHPHMRGPAIQHTLLATQVTVCVLLLFVTVEGLRQFRLMTHGALGFSTERVLQIESTTEQGKTFITTDVAAEIRNSSPDVEDARIMKLELFEPNTRLTTIGSTFKKELKTNFDIFTISAEQLKFFNITVQDADGHPITYNGQSGNALVNRKAWQLLYPEAQNRTFMVNGTPERIIGLLDIRTRSFVEETTPTIFVPDTMTLSSPKLFIRYRAGNRRQAIKAIQRVMNDREIKASDLKQNDYSDHILDFYKEEKHYLLLFTLLSVIGIIISMTGLEAFISHELRLARKNIALRQIYGASLGHLIRNYLPRYLTTSLIGSLISLPLGFSIMRWWTLRYDIQINSGWITAITITILMALFTTVTILLKLRNTTTRESPTHVIRIG